MASANTTLAVKFTGNADDLVRMIDKIKRDMDGMAGNVDASFQRVSKSADKHSKDTALSFGKMTDLIKSHIPGLMGLAGLGGVAFGLKNIVDTAGAAQAGTALFDTQLKALGVTNKATVAGIQDVIDKMSVQYGFAVPKLQAAYSQLDRATKSTTESHKYLSLAMDLARAKGIDVGQAANVISRAYVSGGTSLRRYGIDVQDVFVPGTKHIDKHATALLALAEASKTFGGQASAYAGTWAGAQARFGAALDLVEVKIGTALLPMFTKMLNGLVDIAQWITTHWPQISAITTRVFQDILAGYEKYVAPFVNLFIANVEWLVSEIRQNWGTIKAILEPFWIYFQQHIQDTINVLRGLSDFIKGIFTGNWSLAWKGVKEIVGGVFTDIKATLRLAISELGTIAGLIGKAIWNGITSALTGLGNALYNLIILPINLMIAGIDSAMGAIASHWPNVPGLPGPPGFLKSGIPQIAYRAGGGYVGGSGSGDIVPAMLSPGEVVLNATQQSLVGPSRIATALAMTGGAMGGSHFAKGGTVAASAATYAAGLTGVSLPAISTSAGRSIGNAEVANVIAGGTTAAEATLNTNSSDIADQEIAALRSDYQVRKQDAAKAKQRLEHLRNERTKAVASLKSVTSKIQLAKIKAQIRTLDAAIKTAWRQYEAMEWDCRQIAAALGAAHTASSPIQTAAAVTAKADANVVGGSEDPTMQAFAAQHTEAEVAGNAAGVTAADQGELGYLQGLYKQAVSQGNNPQIVTLGNQIVSLVSALNQNTAATQANTQNTISGSTSISYHGQDYYLGASSSGTLTQLAVGT